MIKNIVFDMGRVLVGYDADRVCRHFMEDEAVRKEECFFIDDMRLNIEGAQACGMDGYCFEDQNIEKLKMVLEKQFSNTL